MKALQRQSAQASGNCMQTSFIQPTKALFTVCSREKLRKLSLLSSVSELRQRSIKAILKRYKTYSESQNFFTNSESKFHVNRLVACLKTLRLLTQMEWPHRCCSIMLASRQKATLHIVSWMSLGCEDIPQVLQWCPLSLNLRSGAGSTRVYFLGKQAAAGTTGCTIRGGEEGASWGPCSCIGKSIKISAVWSGVLLQLDCNFFSAFHGPTPIFPPFVMATLCESFVIRAIGAVLISRSDVWSCRLPSARLAAQFWSKCKDRDAPLCPRQGNPQIYKEVLVSFNLVFAITGWSPFCSGGRKKQVFTAGYRAREEACSWISADSVKIAATIAVYHAWAFSSWAAVQGSSAVRPHFSEHRWPCQSEAQTETDKSWYSARCSSKCAHFWWFLQHKLHTD